MEMGEEFERHWVGLSEEVLSGMHDWRVQHPQATLTEIETEVDARLARMRARLLEHLAQHSRAATWSARGEAEAPHCPDCGGVLQLRGQRTRRLKTRGGQEVHLRRSYGACPQCGRVFFPPG